MKVINLRRPDKTDSLAQFLALELIHGTLPENGLIACENEESAKHLMDRIRYYVDRFTGHQ